VHATVAGVAVDDSRYVRDALLARLRTAAPSNGPAMWGQGYGAEASLGGDGNAASLARSVAGFIAGIDTAADATWRAGVAAGYSRGDVRITDRASAARLVGYHLAGYFGGTLGPVVLRSGAAWTWNDIDTSRTVAFPGFADQLTASYRGNLGQVFAEAALPMAAAGAKWEPYARLVYVDANNAAFSENRGAAALKADGVHASAGYATLGLRIDGTMEVGGAGFTPYASFAWQHTLGNLDPAATLAFVSGGQPFTVLGTPLARDSALIDLGVTLDIAQQASLGVAYSGRFASSLSDNAVNGRFDWRF
jgi:outer membrane autotransporter protein